MLKRIEETLKILLTGGLWLFGYVLFSRLFLFWKWDFDFLSARHWRYLNYIWQNGWRIDTVREWAFVLYLLAFIPIFIAGWVLLFRMNIVNGLFNRLVLIYQKIKNRIVKPIIDEIEDIFDGDDEVDHTIPREIFDQRRSESQPYFKDTETQSETPSVESEDSVEVDPPKEDEKPSVKRPPVAGVPKTDEVGTPTERGLTQNTPAADSDENSIDNILSRLQSHEKRSKHVKSQSNNGNGQKKKPKSSDKKEATPPMKYESDFVETGFTIFKHGFLKKHTVDLLAISAEKAVIVKVMDRDMKWMADEEKINGHPPMWIAENETMPSPMYDLIQAGKELKKKIGAMDSIDVEGVLLIEKGEVANIDDVKSIWKKHHIQAVNANKRGKTDFLKYLGDYLAEPTIPLDEEQQQKMNELLSE